MVSQSLPSPEQAGTARPCAPVPELLFNSFIYSLSLPVCVMFFSLLCFPSRPHIDKSGPCCVNMDAFQMARRAQRMKSHGPAPDRKRQLQSEGALALTAFENGRESLGTQPPSHTFLSLSLSHRLALSSSCISFFLSSP